MFDKQAIALISAVIAVIAVAVIGAFVYWEYRSAPPPTEQQVRKAGSTAPAPDRLKPQDSATAGAIPGDKSLIEPEPVETAQANADPEEIPGDKSLIAPSASAEAVEPRVESPPIETAEAGAEAEEIPGDKSLIEPQPIETAQADDQAEAKTPGDRSLIEPPADGVAAPIETAKADDQAEEDIPGDKV